MLIGVNAGASVGVPDGGAQIESFIQMSGVTFPIVEDSLSTYSAWTPEPSLSPFPLDVVVDRQGTIVYLSREYDADGLKTAIESAL